MISSYTEWEFLCVVYVTKTGDMVCVIFNNDSIYFIRTVWLSCVVLRKLHLLIGLFTGCAQWFL